MDKLICSKCKEEIPDDMAYVSVRGDIILRMPKRKPIVFTCSEQAMNYAQQMAVHDVCWIQLLRDHGVEILNLNEDKCKNIMMGVLEIF
uniref:Uncharacterized protein n=1 Tax=viral metagenome TaxID=1070528 RepID=A0A6M3Y6R5_9ZZZZ